MTTTPNHTPDFDVLPDAGFARLAQLLSPGPLPFSPGTLRRKVKEGQFPKTLKLSTAWRVDDVRQWRAGKGAARAL